LHVDDAGEQAAGAHLAQQRGNPHSDDRRVDVGTPSNREDASVFSPRRLLVRRTDEFEVRAFEATIRVAAETSAIRRPSPATACARSRSAARNLGVEDAFDAARL
jgi:hypothetical protein